MAISEEEGKDVGRQSSSPSKKEPAMSREGLSFRVEMQTRDPGLLAEMFGEERPSLGSTSPLTPGVTARLEALDVRRGLIETTLLVNFVVTVATGVATQVIGDLLSERLKNRKAKVVIDGHRVSDMSSAGIVEIIEESAHAH